MKKLFKWLDNYWYHYKWHTIIGAFFLAIAVIVTLQLVQRESYDAYIMYVGDQSIPETQYRDILNSFDEIASDFDENGTVQVNFSKTAFISDPENELASVTNSVATEFLSTLIVQPYYIYLVTPEVYELYKESDVFVDLQSLFEDLPAECFYDEKAILFDTIPFSEHYAGVDKLAGEQTLLLLKNVPYSRSSSVEKTERAAFANHLTLLKRMVYGATPSEF